MYIVYPFVFMSNKIVSYLILSYGVGHFPYLLYISIPILFSDENIRICGSYNKVSKCIYLKSFTMIILDIKMICIHKLGRMKAVINFLVFIALLFGITFLRKFKLMCHIPVIKPCPRSIYNRIVFH